MIEGKILLYAKGRGSDIKNNGHAHRIGLLRDPRNGINENERVISFFKGYEDVADRKTTG